MKILKIPIFLAIVLMLGLSATVNTEELVVYEKEYDPSTGFVIAPGYKLTTAHCIACHSAKIVTQQGQSRSGWVELIAWMQEEQGLWPIPEDQLETILNYLSTNYGENRPHFEKN